MWVGGEGGVWLWGKGVAGREKYVCVSVCRCGWGTVRPEQVCGSGVALIKVRGLE